jgi:PA14 domain
MPWPPAVGRWPRTSSPDDSWCDHDAAYLYEAFYSPAAQSRNKPPRIELSRLTVRQQRHAVADLIGSFRSPGRWDDQRGLSGEYFKSRQMRNAQRVLERRDPVIQFDFGESSPDPAKIEPPEFAIRWHGSVLAPETGEYEFIVKTENGARLWVNDTARPLLDASCRST